MITVDKERNIPIYLQIYNQIKEQIISGQLEKGSVLLSTRNLARTLQVSRNTVESAYQQLCSEGYVSSKVCSGYIVQKVEVSLYHQFSSQRKQSLSEVLKEFHEQGVKPPAKYNFQYGRLNLEDFPLATWRKMINRVLSSEENNCLCAYNDRLGEADLRVEIMKYLYHSRGVSCKPEQIILCSGTLSCLSIICQLFMDQDRKIAVEEPCYDSARILFQNHGFQVSPIELEEDGLDIGKLNHTSSKLIYATPSHQFPTGTVMPINKRLKLIEWAGKNDAYIIEDDYDSELRYNSRPIPSMSSLDNKGRVIYMNTFSKSFAPALRMSFIVLPYSLLEKYKMNWSKYNCNVPWLEQKAMYLFMKEGNWERHLRKICLLNKRKHDALVNSIHQYMKDRVTIHGKNAGLHILLEVNNQMSEKLLIEKAAGVNVKVYPVSNYWANPQNYTDNMVLMGFSGLSEEEIIEGIQLLESVWFDSPS
ncbi:PLP-dependent aminotransferase family protein [Clostridium aminobutyricum]|uniref:PLP-dependent aminotransferase family protein n=1 Tax=Clostridium aminobutyricum TaxID=33953 RepID=A0A939D713_CLOAM|nr:PLP-dependent aminotransferase family protein [Clostridium aminobutyricum]MBN7772246.1 PLP-dependent aminotransferase family protein [Clostridium aminobutyricum]